MRHPRRQARRGPDLLNAPDQQDDPVTVVSSRVVSAGSADKFRDWTARIDAAVRNRPGHRGNVRLEQAGGIFHLVYQFEDRDQLDAWEAADDYKALMREGERFSISRRQVQSGHETWFDLPSDESAATWKKWLMTWATVFPILLGLNYLSQAVIGSWPQPLRLALTSLIMTAALSWVLLPWITRRLKTWVLQNDDGEVRKPGE